MAELEKARTGLPVTAEEAMGSVGALEEERRHMNSLIPEAAWTAAETARSLSLPVRDIQSAMETLQQLGVMRPPPVRAEYLRPQPVMTRLEPIGRLVASLEAEAKGKAQDREEQRQLAESTLTVLNEILREFQLERQAREKLEAKVQAHEEELIRLRTGAPGRPGSSHLVKAEFQRRAKSSELESTLAEQARVLADWLPKEHPSAAPLTVRTVENVIRHEYRRTVKVRPKT